MSTAKELPALAKIAKEAGDKIAAMQSDIVARKDWIEKPDGSRVTAADLWANAIVCEGLKKYAPEIAIVSEENSYESNNAALKAAERFETDPLDNTTGYTEGFNGWSVNIGRIKDGVPTEGVIYFPILKELYYTDGGKAYLQKGDEPPLEISVRKGALRKPIKVAVGFNEKNADHLGGREFELEKHPAQMRTCKVAMGECDVTGVNKGAGGGFNTYDIAGPHAVLLAAGGDIVERETKKPFRYDNGIKVPDHVAGGVGALVELDLLDKKAVDRKPAQQRINSSSVTYSFITELAMRDAMKSMASALSAPEDTLITEKDGQYRVYKGMGALEENNPSITFETHTKDGKHSMVFNFGTSAHKVGLMRSVDTIAERVGGKKMPLHIA